MFSSPPQTRLPRHPGSIVTDRPLDDIPPFTDHLTNPPQGATWTQTLNLGNGDSIQEVAYREIPSIPDMAIWEPMTSQASTERPPTPMPEDAQYPVDPEPGSAYAYNPYHQTFADYRPEEQQLPEYPGPSEMPAADLINSAPLNREASRGRPETRVMSIPEAAPLETSHNPGLTSGEHVLARRRFHLHEEATDPAIVRIIQDSVITADFKTNLHIEDEQSFLADFSIHLSWYYNCPETAIMVNMSHSAPMIFGASFARAYVLTITAHPSRLAPAHTNDFAVRMQRYIAESLDIPVARGVIKFHALGEANLATNGHTVLHEREKMQKKIAEERQGPVSRAISRHRQRHGGRLFGRNRNDASPPTGGSPPRISNPVLTRASNPAVVPQQPDVTAQPETSAQAGTNTDQTARRTRSRRSFMGLFGRTRPGLDRE